MNHGFSHMIGCILAILAIFLLPAFGASSGVTITVFVVLMLGCHLLMLRGHDHHGDGHAHSHSTKPINTED